MKIFIKFYSEIIVKSKSARKYFIKSLNYNIKNIFLKQYQIKLRIDTKIDLMVINLNRNDTSLTVQEYIEILQRISGIEQLLCVEEYPLNDLQDMANIVVDKMTDKIAGYSFNVRVKRKGKHEFKSIDVEKYIGGALNQAVESARVQLKNPDTSVKIEIIDDVFFLIQKKYQGLGGYPIGTQGEALSLISGGYDSCISSYYMMKRGCKLHYCLFNLGQREQTIEVKKIVHFLWKKYGSSHNVKLVVVDFGDLINEIVSKIDNGLMGIVLKRMFLYFADFLAKKYNIPAIVTGESIGQVSSQTLINLNQINKISDTLVVRPLISMNKSDIINEARNIGIHHLSDQITEYCGVISKNPRIESHLEEIEEEEKKLSLTLIEEIKKNIITYDIKDLDKVEAPISQVEIIDDIKKLSDDDVIIDIRDIWEQEKKPLDIAKQSVLSIPFFKLISEFNNLEQSKNYFLYCEFNTMSKIQALHLHEKGHANVKVLKIK